MLMDVIPVIGYFGLYSKPTNVETDLSALGGGGGGRFRQSRSAPNIRNVPTPLNSYFESLNLYF